MFSPPSDLDRTIAAAKKAGIVFDTRRRIDVFEQFQREGKEAFLSVAPTMLEARNYKIEIDDRKILPLGSISNVLTIYCNEGGEFLIYQSDEHGFHNPKGLYDAGNLEIAVVGDSFADGACVKSEENAVSLIRNHYPRTLNLGMGGNGPLLSLANLKEFAEPLKPKIVLWFYYEGNDLTDLNEEKQSPLILNYLEKEYQQNLISKQAEVDQELKDFIHSQLIKELQKREQETEIGEDLLEFLLLTQLREGLNLHLMNHPDQKDEAPIDFKLFRQILDSAKKLTASGGGELYFVYLPARYNFDDSEFRPLYRKQVLQLVNELKIPIIDVYEPFAAHPDPLSLFPFRLKEHYNKEGYALVANTVIQFIKEKYGDVP